MTSKDFDGVLRVLIHENGEHVQLNDRVVDFRGDHAYIKGGKAPHKFSSSGFVFVTTSKRTKWEREFYTTVFNLRWKTITGR